MLMILAIAAVIGESGCAGSDFSTNSNREAERRLAELARANRMIVERIRGGHAERLAETRDAVTIARVVSFPRRYPDRWLLSTGIFGDYLLLLYDDQRFIGRLGLTADPSDGEVTLNVDDYFRRVPLADVVDLTRQLNVPWPPR